MNKNIAGPSLRALAAAAIGRILVQLDTGQGVADYSRSGVLKEEVHGVQLTTNNVITVMPAQVQSCLTWEITHPSWMLVFKERRTLDEDGAFIKSAPHQAMLTGDLVEAGRFLGIAREHFFDALRADGWTHTQVMIEKLRWLDLPYFRDPGSLRIVLQAR